MNIMLFGFKKCGKTYFGLKAAERLHMPFIDSDLLVEKLYTKIHHKKLSYRDIVKKHGFPFFCELEKHAVSLLLKEKNSIISLGGGVILDPENVERLKQIGSLVYIKAPKEVLLHRFLSHEPPSYVDPLNPISSFEAIYQKRLPIYESIASDVIDIGEDSEEEVLDKLTFLINKIKEKDLSEDS